MMIPKIFWTAGEEGNPGEGGNPGEVEAGGTNGDDYALQDVVEVRS